jgi:hypothetical protein
VTDDVICFCRESARDEIVQLLRFADSGAKIAIAEQIIPHLVAARWDGRRREIVSAIQKVRETDFGRILDIESAASQEFIEEPGAAIVRTGRGAANEGGDGVLGNNIEYAFQDEKVEVFIA